MGPNPDETGDAGSPGARELLPILPIVLIVAWLVRSLEHHAWVATRTAVAISVASAGLIGLPAMFWALDHGHRRLVPIFLLGTLAGVTPLLMIVLSGVAGLAGRGGLEFAWRVLETGAPIPGMGVMPWHILVQAELSAAAIGAVSAAIYWMIFVASWAPGRRRIS